MTLAISDKSRKASRGANVYLAEHSNPNHLPLPPEFKSHESPSECKRECKNKFYTLSQYDTYVKDVQRQARHCHK